MDTFIGLDLGKFTDFCALSVMTRELAIDTGTGFPVRNYRGDASYFWQVLGLRRWPLRTPYSEVIRRLVTIATRADINPAPRVVCDMSGVGTAVFEQVRSALSSYEDVETFGISITAGEKWTATGRGTFNVSKVQLTSCLAETLGCERMVLCPRADGSPMENAAVLEKELAAFKIRVSKTGYQGVEATGSDHDDCVIAISLPLWLGSQRFCQMATMGATVRPGLYTREQSALTREVEAKEVAEAAALDREREGRSLSAEAELERQNALDAEFHADPMNPKWWDDDLDEPIRPVTRPAWFRDLDTIREGQRQ